jgi:hypothetical protein
LAAVVLVGATAVAIGQGRDANPGRGGQPGRQGGVPAAQLTIEQVKPGLYAILNPGANTA